jgi:hypothetical protein
MQILDAFVVWLLNQGKCLDHHVMHRAGILMLSVSKHFQARCRLDSKLEGGDNDSRFDIHVLLLCSRFHSTLRR